MTQARQDRRWRIGELAECLCPHGQSQRANGRYAVVLRVLDSQPVLELPDGTSHRCLDRRFVSIGKGGRPVVSQPPSKDGRSSHMSVAVTAAEKQRYERLASTDGVSVAQAVREALAARWPEEGTRGMWIIFSITRNVSNNYRYAVTGYNTDSAQCFRWHVDAIDNPKYTLQPFADAETRYYFALERGARALDQYGRSRSATITRTARRIAEVCGPEYARNLFDRLNADGLTENERAMDRGAWLLGLESYGS